MLNVLLTIDTEVYPLRPNWRAEGLAQDIHRDIYGECAKGSFGLSYSIDMLKTYGLKASFFVESLFATAIGPDALCGIVKEIQDCGHEIQLHVHPEWLEWMRRPPIHGAGRQTLNQFSAQEQEQIIAMGLANLSSAGANGVCAFRAGDYAANRDTLLALSNNAIKFDTSYNPCYPTSLNDVHVLRDVYQPRQVEGIWEFPVSVWQDCFGNRRHAQLCNSSSAELRGALLDASSKGWHSFVIVSHSFELLKKRRKRVNDPAPDWLVVERFKRLCEFLAENSSRFRTCGFGDLETPTIGLPCFSEPLASPLRRTAWRVLEQAFRRMT